MDYLELNCKVEPLYPGVEILISELAEIGFESFVETESGVLAYIPVKDFDKERLAGINSLASTDDFKVSYSDKVIPDQNWNSAWESNYNPIVVSDKCIVRAPFHSKDEAFLYDIIIEPKMSFGTGHHETTSLMLEDMLETGIKGAKVLDMGCGTSVLAILASKMGAESVVAIDIEEWAYNNSIENVLKNKAPNISVLRGNSDILAEQKFNVILANINRNVLLKDIEVYSKSLNQNGELLLSGFFESDIPAIKSKAETFDLKLVKQQSKNNWAQLHFLK